MITSAGNLASYRSERRRGTTRMPPDVSVGKAAVFPDRMNEAASSGESVTMVFMGKTYETGLGDGPGMGLLEILL